MGGPEPMAGGVVNDPKQTFKALANECRDL
jgi:hypothetical protein